MSACRLRPVALLFVLALAALVLEGASLVHAHDEPGWHNQEHDLGFLVALAAAGLPAAIAAAPFLLAVSRGVRPIAAPRARTVAWRFRAPRAPPAR